MSFIATSDINMIRAACHGLPLTKDRHEALTKLIDYLASLQQCASCGLVGEFANNVAICWHCLEDDQGAANKELEDLEAEYSSSRGVP